MITGDYLHPPPVCCIRYCGPHCADIHMFRLWFQPPLSLRAPVDVQTNGEQLTVQMWRKLLLSLLMWLKSLRE